MTTRTRTLDDLAGSDTIDSRDLIERLRELERQEDPDDAESLDEDEREELAALRAICEEGEQTSPDWTYGETLIRESYFATYAEDYADSVGLIDHNSALAPYVDWERFADDLKSDYSTVEIEGETYYVRA